jgi:hypothetical protein
MARTGKNGDFLLSASSIGQQIRQVLYKKRDRTKIKQYSCPSLRGDAVHLAARALGKLGRNSIALGTAASRNRTKCQNAPFIEPKISNEVRRKQNWRCGWNSQPAHHARVGSHSRCRGKPALRGNDQDPLSRFRLKSLASG